MNWAAYTLIILHILGLGISIGTHGNKIKEGKKDCWASLISTAVVLTLLYYAGFFQ